MSDNTDITVSSTAPSQVSELDVNSKIIKFIKLMGDQGNERFKASRFLTQPFSVDEDAIRRIEAVANERIEKFSGLEKASFKGVVRFSSKIEIRNDDFEEFILGSTDEDEPEAITVYWDFFDIDQNGEPLSASIEVAFITERKLADQEVGLHSVNRAAMSVSVNGSNSNWVRETFNRVNPLIEGKSLRGVYRPLWVFRSQFFNMIMSQVIGFMGLFIGMTGYSRYSGTDERKNTAEILQDILLEKDVSEKINLFSKEFMSPPVTPWWDPIFAFGFGAIVFGVLWTFLGWALPKLAPPSIIAFGSSSEKSKRRFGLYNAIVFSLLGGSIVIPIIHSVFL